jgi:hypothetical protein
VFTRRRRLPMRSLPFAAALLLSAVAAAAQTAHTEPAPSAAGTAESIGATFKRGVDRLATSAEEGASDLWEAGKAAYAAGARTLHEREAARDQPKPPPGDK